MKITFLVGGLEPGANGVGDYTRLLAGEIERQRADVFCQLVALHDDNVDAPQRTSGDLTQLRLPAAWPWPKRIELARSFIDDFAPDWLSLQFVPYAFHPRGLIRGLAEHLQTLTQKRRLHIMFHESWIGANAEADLKSRAVGRVQRHLILRMIRQLAPAALSTSNGVYIEMLGQSKPGVEHLPLFGNIPVAAQNLADAKDDEFWRAMISALPAPSARQNLPLWTGVFFGSLHPMWSAEPLLSCLIEAARQQQKRLCLVAIGRLGAAGDSIWEEMSRKYSSEVTFIYRGEQPSQQISLLFQKADFGIAASPWQLIEKSGSAAAMLDHGLPVLVNRDDWHWRGKAPVTPPSDPLLHRFDGAAADVLMNLPKRAPGESLPAVAAKFLRQLDEAKRGS